MKIHRSWKDFTLFAYLFNLRLLNNKTVTKIIIDICLTMNIIYTKGMNTQLQNGKLEPNINIFNLLNLLLMV